MNNKKQGKTLNDTTLINSNNWLNKIVVYLNYKNYLNEF